MSVLEVTGEHVKALDDKQLRDLVVRLCRAELRRLGLPLHALTDGGHQNAADGGVDVRIELPHSADAAPGMDFIRRKHTVFQCKAEDMPRKAIAVEMKPRGVLRPVIAELIQQGGAYIIVSSGGTVADKRLRDRRQAMRDCVAGLAGEQDFLLDFYDRKRLARWACQYPGVAAWVRESVGQPIDGWRTHGEWAARRSGHTPYEADAHPRLWTGEADQQTPRPIADGLRALRDRLVRERGVARLVGLSGTGKTRLAQALFEEDIDPGGALDPALALYADLAGDGRDRLAFLTRLQSDGLRAIVVLDNCPPDQHRLFADLCGGEGSRLSLLTLNLDVQDDQPEDTQVFKLEAASADVTARIIRQEPRSAPLGSAACRRIAELAGGNARLAQALALSVPAGSLAKFRDADLFDRLFHQGRSRDDALLRAARACALVYSFNSGSGGDTSELAVLAGWAGTDARSTLYGHVAELQRRGLAQQRDVWRAVLPQALALHLAREALMGLLPHVLEQSLQQAPSRLMKSFTRQLGLLHDSPQAQALVRRWLAPGGQPCDPSVFNEDEMAWFLNLAPVDPSITLSALEQADLPDEGAQRSRLLHLCMTLAYDEDIFPRAIRLVARWLPEAPHDYYDMERDHRKDFRRLFQLLASGTQAGPSTRLGMMQELLCPDRGPAHWLGFEALAAMLRAGLFDGFTHQEFGARVRDHGWWPTEGQRGMWYASVLEWMCQQAQGPLRNGLQRKFLAALPGLCAEADCPAIADALAAGVRALIVGSSASGGAWAAVKVAVHNAMADSPQPGPTAAQIEWMSQQAKRILSKFLQPGCPASYYDALNAELKALIIGRGTSDGAWAAVKSEIHTATADSLPADPTSARQPALHRERLEQLESLLRPSRWIDEVRAYALVHQWDLAASMAEAGEPVSRAMDRLDDQVRELGRELAIRPADIDTLLPELMSNPVLARENALGQGLGEAIDPNLCRELWRQMGNAYSTASPGHRHVRLLCGFLAGIANTTCPWLRSSWRTRSLIQLWANVFRNWNPACQQMRRVSNASSAPCTSVWRPCTRTVGCGQDLLRRPCHPPLWQHCCMCWRVDCLTVWWRRSIFCSCVCSTKPNHQAHRRPNSCNAAARCWFTRNSAVSKPVIWHKLATALITSHGSA